MENDGNNPTATTNACVRKHTATKRSSKPGAFSDWETSANPMITSNRVEGTAVYNPSRGARAGSTPHIVRYLLGFSLALAILAMSVMFTSYVRL